MISRKFLKDRLVEIIKDAGTLAGDNVEATRAIPTDINNLPKVLIYLKNEQVDIFDESPRRYRRNAVFNIECIASGSTDSDADTISEQLVKEVEEALALDETLGTSDQKDDCVNDSVLGSVSFQSEPDGQSPVAVGVLSFDVEYFTIPNTKTDGPDFLRAGVEWQVGHHDESSDEIIDAEDIIDIP